MLPRRLRLQCWPISHIQKITANTRYETVRAEITKNAADPTYIAQTDSLCMTVPHILHQQLTTGKQTLKTLQI